MSASTLTPELLHKIDAYWRAANYLSVGQIYLMGNPLLRQALAPELGRDELAVEGLQHPGIFLDARNGQSYWDGPLGHSVGIVMLILAAAGILLGGLSIYLDRRTGRNFHSKLPHK